MKFSKSIRLINILALIINTQFSPILTIYSRSTDDLVPIDYPVESLQEPSVLDLEDVAEDQKLMIDNVVEDEDYSMSENASDEDYSMLENTSDEDYPMSENTSDEDYSMPENTSDEDYSMPENTSEHEVMTQNQSREVHSFEELKIAIADSEVSNIIVSNDLRRHSQDAETAIGSLDRSISIQGNGHLIDFGANDGSLHLISPNNEEGAVVRLENVMLTKEGNQPLFQAESSTSYLWTLELENVQEKGTANFRLASIPSGKVIFTGDKNQFIQPEAHSTFVEAKEVEFQQGAQVEIERGNATVFFSSASIPDPMIKIHQSSKVKVETAIGTANTIDLRGARPQIHITGDSGLEVTTAGNGTPTNLLNNALVLTGANSRVEVTQQSSLKVMVMSHNKRAIHLAGTNPNIYIENSSLDVSTATGTGVNLSGANAKIKLIHSHMTSETTSGQQVNLVGNNAQLMVQNSVYTLANQAATARGIYLEGNNPQLIVKEASAVSLLSPKNINHGRMIRLNGQDALFHITESSNVELDIGTGTNTVVSIGEGEASPTLRVDHNSVLSIQKASGQLSGSITSDRAIRISGTQSTVEILDESELLITIDAGSTNAIHFDNSPEGRFTVVDSYVELNYGNGTAITLSQHSPNSTIEIINSELTTEGTGQNSLFYIDSAGSTLSISDKSIINITARATTLSVGSRAENFTLNISTGSQVNTTATADSNITINAHHPSIIITGQETNVSLVDTSNSTQNATAAVAIGRLAPLSGVNIDIKDGAVVTLDTARTGILLNSPNGRFNVSDEANLRIKQRNSPGMVLRGSWEVNLDNGKLFIDQSSRQPAILMRGENHQVKVGNGGELVINSQGEGISSIEGGGNSLIISDPDSKMEITSSSMGISMEDLSGEITVENGATLQIEGVSPSESQGIIDARELNVYFNTPGFIDLRNNRSGGGNIFSVSPESKLLSIDADLALWKKGEDLNQSPNKDWIKFDYELTGKDFTKIVTTNVPEEFNDALESLGSEGLTGYTRLSSINTRAIVDELRVPTNADKSIFGHVSIPLGSEGSRSANTDEVRVEVKIERVDGKKEYYEAHTVGSSGDSSGISIYGEEPRPGIFQIKLDDYLQAGDKVTVIGAVRGPSEERSYVSLPEDIQVTSVTTFPIIPPKPVKMQTLEITTEDLVLQGQMEEISADVLVTHNGQWLDIPDMKVNSDGTFEIPIGNQALEVGDQFQIFLKDKASSAKVAGVVNPPYTNDEVGNMNPLEPLVYHDAYFEAAPIVTVEPREQNPLDPLNPEVEVNPENRPILPDNQGVVSIDFISKLDFGVKEISATTQKYFAKPQRLLDENEILIEGEERPNYIQVTDQRPTDNRGGWELSLVQESPWMSEDGKELKGAQLTFRNAELVDSSGTLLDATSSSVESVKDQFSLVIGNGISLIETNSLMGGTVIYRFGNHENFGESVILEVPDSATPHQTAYSTTLDWQLMAVPNNTDLDSEKS